MNVCASVRRPWVRRVVGRARLCDRCGRRRRQRAGHNIYICSYTTHIHRYIQDEENDATGNVFLIGKLCRNWNL